MRQQRAVVSGDREIALMPLHRCGEHCVRELEELRVEVPGDGDRPFDERSVLLEQRRVDERPSAECFGRALDLFPDDVHALADPRHDMTVAPKDRDVFAGVPKLEIPRVVEPMPTGGSPGDDSEHLGFDDVRRVHEQHPVHRAHELGVVVGPPHPPRHREPVERALDHLREQRSERGAGPRGSIGEPCAFSGLESPRAPPRAPGSVRDGMLRFDQAVSHRPWSMGKPSASREAW